MRWVGGGSLGSADRRAAVEEVLEQEHEISSRSDGVLHEELLESKHRRRALRPVGLEATQSGGRAREQISTAVGVLVGIAEHDPAAVGKVERARVERVIDDGERSSSKVAVAGLGARSLPGLLEDALHAATTTEPTTSQRERERNRTIPARYEP